MDFYISIRLTLELWKPWGRSSQGACFPNPQKARLDVNGFQIAHNLLFKT